MKLISYGTKKIYDKQKNPWHMTSWLQMYNKFLEADLQKEISNPKEAFDKALLSISYFADA